MTLRRLVPLLLAAAVLTGCSSGQGCGDLPKVTAERDAAREQWRLVLSAARAGTATDADVSEAHDRMHALDARAYDLRQSCEG